MEKGHTLVSFTLSVSAGDQQNSNKITDLIKNNGIYFDNLHKYGEDNT